MSPEPVLTQRALNRATLARQHLLDRSGMAPLAMVEHLVGLQAQESNPPYLGLWTRLRQFEMADLTRLLDERQAVRCALQRGTLHVLAAADLLAMRPLLQPMLARALATNHGRKLGGADSLAVARAGREMLCAEPLDGTQLGKRLAPQWPGAEPASLAVAVRCHEALIQLPPAGTWENHKNAVLLPADVWLKKPLSARPSLDKMLLRYFAAFGPASAQDAAVWSGLALTGESGINAALERLAPKLRRYSDERGRTLLDLKTLDLPDADTPAPVRLVPGFDNLVLSHADRSRLMDEAHRPHIFTVNGQIRATVLLDGRVAGLWKLVRDNQRDKQRATLRVEPFRKLRKAEQQAIEAEADALLAFAAPQATGRDVEFTSILAG